MRPAGRKSEQYGFINVRQIDFRTRSRTAVPPCGAPINERSAKGQRQDPQVAQLGRARGDRSAFTTISTLLSYCSLYRCIEAPKEDSGAALKSDTIISVHPLDSNAAGVVILEPNR